MTDNNNSDKIIDMEEAICDPNMYDAAAFKLRWA